MVLDFDEMQIFDAISVINNDPISRVGAGFIFNSVVACCLLFFVLEAMLAALNCSVMAVMWLDASDVISFL